MNNIMRETASSTGLVLIDFIRIPLQKCSALVTFPLCHPRPPTCECVLSFTKNCFHLVTEGFCMTSLCKCIITSIPIISVEHLPLSQYFFFIHSPVCLSPQTGLNIWNSLSTIFQVISFLNLFSLIPHDH